ncbi:type II toxin-antitoxin system RelE/ParE family toxin [Labrys wisconsinensis]|uniref:Addiction module RelE/StbE family toxin n=1 Tax=Labrys wisconsinensis TaxID=425677 RepID=A0ABU0J7X5_9HYPH|nr:type II toxin-antitoxin system RelE/ParE family toxin [Labrys wisconsinensis]MDQ0470376.1 addiction module RelE/StbE family toxin [Labrys wisconsinensis]
MRLAWTRPSRNDLEAIADHIAQDSPAAARDQLDKVKAAAGMLIRHPQLGRAGRVRGTKELVIAHTPYILIYRVTGEIVDILRVLHAARRWPPKP